MKQVSVEQAKAALADLVDEALGGEEIVVVHDGSGSVRLVPMPGKRATPKFGSAKGLITMSDDFDEPLEEFREYME